MIPALREGPGDGRATPGYQAGDVVQERGLPAATSAPADHPSAAADHFRSAPTGEDRNLIERHLDVIPDVDLDRGDNQ